MMRLQCLYHGLRLYKSVELTCFQLFAYCPIVSLVVALLAWKSTGQSYGIGRKQSCVFPETI
jgi:hypothetical protein